MRRNISEQAQNLLKLATLNIHTKTKLVTFTSGKGGVGKSTLSANIAYLIGEKGLKVCILDADVGLANLQVLLNVKPSFTIFDYIEGRCEMDELLTATSYENLVLVAGKSGYQYATSASSFVFSRVIHDVLSLNKFDILIVDTGAGLSEYVQEFLEISPNIFAITTTDPSALTDVYALIKMLSEIGKKDVMIAFNHTKLFSTGVTISKSLSALAQKNNIRNEFMIKYLGNISTSQNLSSTAKVRKMYTKEYWNEACAQELRSIADEILKNIK
jgi:flagellar biosynthesis protein FlhG